MPFRQYNARIQEDVFSKTELIVHTKLAYKDAGHDF